MGIQRPWRGDNISHTVFILRNHLAIRHGSWTSSYSTLNDTKPSLRRWTEAEDRVIVQSRNEGKTAEETQASLPGRTLSAVEARRKTVNKKEPVAIVARRTAFTPAEDARLLASSIERLPWSVLLQEFPGRNASTLIVVFDFNQNRQNMPETITEPQGPFKKTISKSWK